MSNDKQGSIKTAKMAAEESVPFDIEKVLEIAHLTHAQLKEPIGESIDESGEENVKPKKLKKQKLMKKKKRAKRLEEEKKARMEKVTVGKTDVVLVKPEVKPEALEVVELPDFVPPEGVSKRGAWKRWR